MYQFWLGDILLPITPEKVTIACGTKNTLFDCVNGNEVVFSKTGKLKTIKFQAVLPNTEYPFSRYTVFPDGDWHYQPQNDRSGNLLPPDESLSQMIIFEN